MTRRQTIAVVAAALLLLVAVPASAQQIVEHFAEKIATFWAVMAVASFLFQMAFVRLGAWFFGLEGGTLHAFGAVVLGGIFSVVATFGAVFAVLAMPPLVQGLACGAAMMSGFALAVKLLFKCRFPKALLITLVAFTLNFVGGAIVMIIMY